MIAMEALAAILAAAALAALFGALLWGIARSSRRLLGNDAVLSGAIERCASCAEKPVCETGALAGWLSSRPARCPNLELLQKRQPL
jgi:hypothetical protein